jgi:hypothetical protein
MSQQESMLVISAHAADFVWRAGQTPVFEAKRKAMECMGAPQSTLGEAYMRVFPQVTDRLS